MYPTPRSSNIVKGFEELGYRTIGIGGVHWFNTKFPTSNFWKDMYFQEFYWDESFSELDALGFEKQIKFVKEELKFDKSKELFFFQNVSSTHIPYLGLDQAKSLEYVDNHIMELLDVLPKPIRVIVVADHGDCCGEDGLFGHGFYHEKVMEVPMLTFVLD